MNQWYSIDPEHGIEVWGTLEEAKAAAESSLEYYRDRASDGWHEQMEAIEWGELIPHGFAKEVDRVEREDDETGLCERIGADYRCDYVLESCEPSRARDAKQGETAAEDRAKTLAEVFAMEEPTEEQKKNFLLVNLGIAK